MEEDNVRFWELLSRFLRDSYVDVLVEGGVDESNIVVADDLDKLFPCAGEFLWWAIVTLEPNLDSVVIFVEFDFGLTHVSRLLDLLEEVLTVEPHHLHGIELYRKFPRLFLRHMI